MAGLLGVGCGTDKASSEELGTDEVEDHEIGLDSDGDTILDLHEGELDADGDGVPNYLDLDSDGDGVLDSFEAGDRDLLTLPVDSDQDGVPDFLDLDSDGNCLPDTDEALADAVTGLPSDLDSDGVADFQDRDDDADGILDVDEMDAELCADRDSDGDGKADRVDIESDGDGIGDLWEGGITEIVTSPVDTDGDGVPDYLDSDSDGDGLSDREEGGVDSPLDEPRDTDGDGIYDFLDLDSDGDGLSDADEAFVYGADPYDADTDGDGFTDGIEHFAGTDPLDATSVPTGIFVDLPERTSAEVAFEFDIRIQKADVGFLLDTTCSMSGTAQTLASEFSRIVTELAYIFPDAEYGFATFDDYANGTHGQVGVDMPHVLRHQITSSTSRIQSAMANVEIHNGVDGVASPLESIYQSLTGEGYDMNCDTILQGVLDVPPFLASADDPFGGLEGQAWSPTPPGGGMLGGMGFREQSLPIIIYASDTWMRDSLAGYGTPGGCPQDANRNDVAAALEDLGARLLAVCTGGTVCEPQMEQLAIETGNYADLAGDGTANDPLVVLWDGSDEEFRDTVVTAIEDLVNSIRFDRVELSVVGDEWGFVTDIDPLFYDDVSDLGEGEHVLEFTLTFLGVVPSTSEDAIYTLVLDVLGDETVLLGSQTIFVRVPGSTD